MIKRMLIVLLAIFGAGLVIPGIASAHVLKVDGNIGAVLHINPDDNPTTGDSTDYTLSFDDDTGKFTLPKCSCNVSIIENGKTIDTRPLVISSSEVSENRYTFTKPDIYVLRFIGTPKTDDAFQPFTLNYEVRVTDGQMNAQPMPLTLWVGMGMFIGLVLLAAYTMENDTMSENKEE